MALILEEAFLPATLTAPSMSDEEFFAFCNEHPDLSFEMSAEGELIVMPPPFNTTGLRETEIVFQLRRWAESDGRGVAVHSDLGVVLPNGARRSPDVSWILKTEIAKLTQKSRDTYWHLCPSFVVELRSDTDRLRTLRAKMAEYIANGAQLGWLIDPEARSKYIGPAGSQNCWKYRFDCRRGAGGRLRMKPTTRLGAALVSGSLFRYLLFRNQIGPPHRKHRFGG